RPDPKIEDFKMVKRLSQNADAVAMLISGSGTVKFSNNSIENISGMGVTQEYNQIWDLKIEQGRYLTVLESQTGRPVAILGATVAENLFPNQDPMSKKFKFNGRKLQV